jgi:hypothetical protein
MKLKKKQELSCLLWKMQESERSVKVMQEHKGIMDILERKISQLEGSSQEVTEEIKTFVRI